MGKFRVIGAGIAFLILAGISCWATEKSLHMLLPVGWPEILVWGMTIAFFVVASIGTKLIADSLMSSGFVENRKGKLWGGIFLVVFFLAHYEYADKHPYLLLQRQDWLGNL